LCQCRRSWLIDGGWLIYGGWRVDGSWLIDGGWRVDGSWLIDGGWRVDGCLLVDRSGRGTIALRILSSSSWVRDRVGRDQGTLLFSNDHPARRAFHT
jgi:hypothetical protein